MKRYLQYSASPSFLNIFLSLKNEEKFQEETESEFWASEEEFKEAIKDKFFDTSATNVLNLEFSDRLKRKSAELGEKLTIFCFRNEKPRFLMIYLERAKEEET